MSEINHQTMKKIISNYMLSYKKITGSHLKDLVAMNHSLKLGITDYIPYPSSKPGYSRWKVKLYTVLGELKKKGFVDYNNQTKHWEITKKVLRIYHEKIT